MPAPRKYPDELRERAIRLVLDIEEETGNTTAACRRVGGELGINPDTLRGWVKRAQIDSGKRPGTTTADAARIRQLERENAELRRANAILRTASAFSRPSWATTDPGDRVHRRPPGPVRGPADLTGLDRTRCADRAGHLPRGQKAPAVCAGMPGWGAAGRDQAGLQGEWRGLRGAQGMAAAAPRARRLRAVHRGTADAPGGPARGAPRPPHPHHHPRQSRRLAAGPGQPRLPRRRAEPAAGGGHHLRAGHRRRVRLRGVRDRRVLPADRRLEGGRAHARLAGPRRPGDGGIGAASRRPAGGRGDPPR